MWYRYGAGSTFLLSAQAMGSNPALAVFEDDGGDELRLVGCGSSLVNPAARVTFQGLAGTTYWFQVATSTGRPLAFTLDAQGRTERVSLAVDGGDPDSVIAWAELSTDGRHVVFESWASNVSTSYLATGPVESYDIFVHDREARTTKLVSISSSGEPGNDGNGYPAISADGQHVAFGS